MKRWTIYCHTHIESGRRYVGITSRTMERRWAQHCCQAKSSKGGRWHFPNAIRKYGPEAFEHTVLGVYNSLEEANDEEKKLIAKWDLQNPEKGFNLAPGGGAQPHPIRKNPWDNPEYRAKQTPSLIARTNTLQSRANNKAALNTLESKTKRSAISKELMNKPGMKEKLLASIKTRVYSPETLAKMSIASRGHLVSLETREKHRMNGLGRKHAEEAKIKMKLARQQQKVTPEASEKTARKNRRYRIENGNVTHKVCRVHGLISIIDCVVGVKPNGRPRVTCKMCTNGHKRERRRQSL